jgi:hypothetical protein
MAKHIHRVTTVVRAIEPVSKGVLAFTLADPDELGAAAFHGRRASRRPHPGGPCAVSLFGDPAERNCYVIGSSARIWGGAGRRPAPWIEHRDGRAGLAAAQDHFPLRPGPRHVLIAAGIGITPFLSMMPELRSPRRALRPALRVAHPERRPS